MARNTHDGRDTKLSVTHLCPSAWSKPPPMHPHLSLCPVQDLLSPFLLACIFNDFLFSGFFSHTNMHESSQTSSAHGILQARILEWVGIPFSRGSSPPRVWTWVSHVAGGCLTAWATKETPKNQSVQTKPCCQLFLFYFLSFSWNSHWGIVTSQMPNSGPVFCPPNLHPLTLWGCWKTTPF